MGDHIDDEDAGAIIDTWMMADLSDGSHDFGATGDQVRETFGQALENDEQARRELLDFIAWEDWH